MAGGASPRGVKPTINVTPLVDVVLVLLIIFMVVTPLLARGKDVRLPRAHKPDTESAGGDPLLVSVTFEKEAYLGQTKLDEAALTARLRAELAARPDRRVLLRADERLSYGDVRRVMDVARGAGAKGVSLGVRDTKGE